MRLEEFTYVPFEARDKSLKFLANLIGRPDIDPRELSTGIEAALARSLQQDQFLYTHNDHAVSIEAEADAILFRLDVTTPTGEEIFAKCMANKRPGALQRWFGLFFQAARREGFFIGDLCFRSWNDGARFLDELATMAIPEKWSYASYASKQNHPILKSIVEKTYERLKQQEKLIRTPEQILFNTGLINTWFKEIYVVADIDPENPHRFLNAHPVLENDRTVLDTFRNTKPQMATFFTRINDVVYDPDLEIITDDAHILEDNFDRIPEEYKRMRKSQVFALFQAAVDFARIMARRNYKLIVPQFFNGRIQFLMPIYLSGEFTGPPDFALALEKMNNCYRGNTILTLDMAFQNARLIAKPETTWLSPDSE